MPLADTSLEYWPRTWQAALGSGTTFPPPPLPLPFSHINGVFSIVRDIKGLNKQYQAQFGPIQALHVKPSITTLFSRSMVIRDSNYFLQPCT